MPRPGAPGGRVGTVPVSGSPWPERPSRVSVPTWAATSSKRARWQATIPSTTALRQEGSRPTAPASATVRRAAPPGRRAARSVATFWTRSHFSDYGQTMVDDALVPRVRRFNRTVTQRLGVLQDRYLARDHSLGEARLLW